MTYPSRQPLGLIVFALFLLASSLILIHYQSLTLAAAPPLAFADVTTPVINHPSSQESPAIDQQRVVWQDFRAGPTDIFLADLQNQTIMNLTQTNPDWEVQPDIDGDLVVWKDGYNGIGIHGLNIATGQKFTVTEGHSDTSRPRLSGNIVVWADNRAGGEDWNIYGYDIATQTELVISTAPGRQQDPQIDGNLVVWWDNQEHLLLYNLDTKQTQTVLGTRGARLPAVSAADQLVVWQDIRNGDWDIYGYDLTTKTEKPLVLAPDDQENVAIADGLVTYQSRIVGLSWQIQLHILASSTTFALADNSSLQTQPAVSGNVVVWQDNRNHQTDIYQFTWAGNIPSGVTHPVAAPSHLQVGAFPAQKIYLQWRDNDLDETGYTIERAHGITGTAWSAIATLPANTTVFTDTPEFLGESYWYRVRAHNGLGNSAYSNESFNTTFATVPSADELYLMALINEARAAPALFGYPAYPAVPPLAYNPLVAYSARAHSQSILNSVFQFGHCDPIGRCPTERVRAVRYANPSGCSENLTTGDTGYQIVEATNRSFLDSTGHRNNMLNADAKEFGIGHTYDSRKGEASRHGQFTEVFCAQTNFTIPALPTGAVTPYTGPLNTAFTYMANFYSAQGAVPTLAQVFIDGLPHAMTLSSGRAAHGTYRYTTTLPLGQHDYYFQFTYGANLQARWPQNGALLAPLVYDPADPPTPTPLPPILTPVPTATPGGQTGQVKIYLPLVER